MTLKIRLNEFNNIIDHYGHKTNMSSKYAVGNPHDGYIMIEYHDYLDFEYILDDLIRSMYKPVWFVELFFENKEDEFIFKVKYL